MPLAKSERSGVSSRRFTLGLVVASITGLVIRIIYVVIERGRFVSTVSGKGGSVLIPFYDGGYYHLAARYLIEGRGWIQPYNYLLDGTAQASANHPPAWILALVVATRF